MEKKEIIGNLKSKVLTLLSRIDDSSSDSNQQTLNIEECPLDFPEQLSKEFYDYLKSLYLELQGPDAPVQKLTDSYLKYVQYAIQYKSDSEIAYQDAQRRTLWERITNSNNEDILAYKQAQFRYAEYLLRALAKDFLEDVVGDDTFLLWD